MLFWVLLSKVLAAAVLYLFSIIVIWKLGAEEAGVFFTLQSFSMVAGALGRLGLENVLLRQLSVDGEFSRDLPVKRLTLLVLSFSLGSVFLLHWAFFESAGDAEFDYNFVIVPSLLFVLGGFIPFSFQAFNYPRVSLWLPYSATAAIAGSGIYFFEVTGEQLFAVYCCILALIGGCCIYSLSRFYSSASTNRRSRPFASFLKEGLFLYPNTIFSAVVQWSAPILTAYYFLPEDVSMVSLATRTAALVTMVSIAVNSIYGRKFAILWSEENIAELRLTFSKLCQKLALFGVAAFCGVFVMSFVILPAQIFPMPEKAAIYFSRESINLYLIAFAYSSFAVAVGPAMKLLLVCEQGHVVSLLSLLGIFVLIVSIHSLSQAFGLLGVVLCLGLSVCLTNGVAYILVVRLLSGLSINGDAKNV